MDAINWVLANKEGLLVIYFEFVGLMSAIVKFLIPVLPADSKLLPIVKFIAKWLALNKTVTAEMRPK